MLKLNGLGIILKIVNEITEINKIKKKYTSFVNTLFLEFHNMNYRDEIL
jgi:hypothetical protein